LYEYKKDKSAGELSESEKDERESRNNREFLNINPERELLEKHFEESESGDKFTSTDIKILLETRYPGQKLIFAQLSRELKRLFGEPIMTRHNGIQGRYFKLSTDLNNEVQNNTSYNYQESNPF